MATLSDLIIEVKDALGHCEVKKSPSQSAIIRALNRSKDELVGMMEMYDPNQFVERLDYEVANSQPYIELPGTGNDTYQTVSTENRCRRIIAVTDASTSSNAEIKIRVYDHRDEGVRESWSGYWMYREGDRLYFSPSTGAPQAFTLRLRYAAAVDDLSDDKSLEYDYIPPEWTDLIAIGAITELLPPGNAGRYKWDRRKAERLEQMRMTIARKVNQQPMRIRRVEQDEWIY